MSLLTYNELVKLVDNGVIRGVPRENINGASIDVTLGKWFMVEAPAGNNNNVVDLMANGKRRACFDGRCAVRETCQLWTRRDEPGYATRCMTWLTHWLCFSDPCDYHLPVGAT